MTWNKEEKDTSGVRKGKRKLCDLAGSGASWVQWLYLLPFKEPCSPKASRAELMFTAVHTRPKIP